MKIYLGNNAYLTFYGSARILAIEREGTKSHKSLPRKKIPIDLESLCRVHTEKSIRTIAGVMRNSKELSAMRVTAAVHLLDRGWGKPAQTTKLEGSSDNPIVVEIIQSVVEGQRSRRDKK